MYDSSSPLRSRLFFPLRSRLFLPLRSRLPFRLSSAARTLTALLMTLLLSGCAWLPLPWSRDEPPPPPTQPFVLDRSAAGDNSRNALDWSGSYEGMVPCADCEGILTRLTLREDQSYSLSREYLGRNPIAFIDSGRFIWSDAGDRIFLDREDDGTPGYLVGENRLFQLDLDGNRITGALADNYILHKLDAATLQPWAPLVGRRWLLQELRGRPIPAATDPAEQLFLQFNAESRSVHGYAGCNLTFSSQFTIEAPTRLRFSDLVSSLGPCRDDTGTAREGELVRILMETDSYAVANGRLSLFRARMAPLAVFIAE